MKQYLSILAALILCFSATTLKAQIVIIPDANFKAYLLSSPVNTNLDFEIQLSEAQNFTGTINLIGQNITDLTGLEEFTALRFFYCEFVPITSLDLSANTMLTHLRCAQNLFTSLDLSNNINLTHLTCNQLKITDLDLSNNVNLVELDCRFDSLLTTINVKNGNNTAIPNTKFFVNDNPMLQCIEVDSVAYSVANWTNVDNSLVYNNNCFTNITTTENISNIQAYPNPTKNTLTIDLGTIYPDANITILNAIGQRIETTSYKNTQILDLEIKGLLGWYFIQIETEKGSQTVKVLKQ